MKILLVIDGDNISSNQFSSWWNTFDNKQLILEKIIFGDFSKQEMIKWQKFGQENNFDFLHCPIRIIKNTVVKQTTDLNIFIHVMTKLYEKNYDSLYIVTDDSDFIYLANAWIKNNKLVTFLITGNCSHLIKNNFNIIELTKKKSKTIKNKLENIVDTKKENISIKLLEFLENNNETNVKNIQIYLEKYYGKIRPSRIIKLITLLDSNYIWININDNDNTLTTIFYYPKIEELKELHPKTKKLKSWIKIIDKIYPNFSKNVLIEKIEDLFN